MHRNRSANVAAYGLAVWGLVFALIHVYWALGGGIGLPDGFVMRDHRALYIIDLVAIPLSLLVAAIGWVVATDLRHRFSPRLVTLAIWTVAALCLVHSVPVLIDLAMGLLDEGRSWLDGVDDERWFSAVVYEPYWFIGGILALVAAVAWQREPEL